MDKKKSRWSYMLTTTGIRKLITLLEMTVKLTSSTDVNLALVYFPPQIERRARVLECSLL